MIYCPYTDRELPENQASREHIIPLSLGGCDALQIPVDAGFNSKVGSELDGALANDFLIAYRRTRFDARGHSGREPCAVIKNARYGDDDRPAQVSFHKRNGLRLWDARERKPARGEQIVRLSAKVNLDLPVRFTAKVALAAGYYAYGDVFRRHVDHVQLRTIMNTDPAKLDPEQGAEGAEPRPRHNERGQLHVERSHGSLQPGHDPQGILLRGAGVVRGARPRN